MGFHPTAAWIIFRLHLLLKLLHNCKDHSFFNSCTLNSYAWFIWTLYIIIMLHFSLKVMQWHMASRYLFLCYCTTSDTQIKCTCNVYISNLHIITKYSQLVPVQWSKMAKTVFWYTKVNHEEMYTTTTLFLLSCTTLKLVCIVFHFLIWAFQTTDTKFAYKCKKYLFYPHDCDNNKHKCKHEDHFRHGEVLLLFSTSHHVNQEARWVLRIFT